MAASVQANRNEDQKRETYLIKYELPMNIAILLAQRSKDGKTQVGACIVDDENKIIGCGYNGMPLIKGIEDNDTVGSLWRNRHIHVLHAESNAIRYKTGSVEGATMYVTLHPCYECAKIIVENKIKKVIYLDKKDSKNIKVEDSKKHLEENQIVVMRFSEYLESIETDGNVVTRCNNLSRDLNGLLKGYFP